MNSESVLQKSREAPEFETLKELLILRQLAKMVTDHPCFTNAILAVTDAYQAGWQASRSALEPMLAERGCFPYLPSPCGHPGQYAFTSDGGKHIDCLVCDREAAERALREAQADKPTPPNQRYAELAENRANEIAKLGRENEKLRELLRRSVRELEYYFRQSSEHPNIADKARSIIGEAQQALSPSPTPAPDTNTQSLCRAKPSPDSATPQSSSSVVLPSLPPDDAAVHNARQGVISALPGTADRSKALDELVRAEMEDGTYWRIPCDCSKSHRSECKRCAGKGWLDARAATTGKGEQG